MGEEDHQVAVGGWKGIKGKVGRGDPFYFGYSKWTGIIREVAANKGVKPDMGVGVIVVDGREWLANFNGEADFFESFADGARGGGFTGEAFAAGEFPVVAENRGGEAPADENLPGQGMENCRQGDVDAWGLWRRLFHWGPLKNVASASRRWS